MSQNRIRANQQNATRSGGPKSERGKAITRGNALRHGLRAEQVTIFDERPEDFEALCGSLYDSLKPQDPLQEQLVDRVAVCFWRLRRIPNLEAGIVEYQSLHNDLQNLATEIKKHTDPIASFTGSSLGTGEIPASLKRQRTQILNKLGNGQSAYGEAFCRDIKSHDALGKLSRYESQISRELFRTLNQLERLQAKALFLELKPEGSSS